MTEATHEEPISMNDDQAPPLRLVCRTSALPEEVKQDFATAFEVEFLPHTTPVDELPEADALLVTVDAPLGAEDLRRLPRGVRAIATYSVGLDHIDLEAARVQGFAVFNTPGVLADSVADAALLLILGAARRASESIALIRGGDWPGWNACQLNGVELGGKVLGVYGMGQIGRRIAARARAFGMSVVYSDQRPVADGSLEARFLQDPDALFQESDVLVLTAPSTPETRGFVDARRLAAARPGLILVNVARGDLVVDDALVDALRRGTVWAAGLDVFNGEPALDPRYLQLPNAFLTPHIGSSTMEARRRMASILIEALSLWRQGARPVNQVVP